MNEAEPMSNDGLSIKQQEGVLYIQFNRPNKKNALTAAMFRSLAQEINQASATQEIGAIVLHGAGDCFTAGADITLFAENRDAAAAIEFLHAISACETPIIAAVQGVAVGIGLTLLLHCDFVFADDTARFSAPFVDLGLCVEGGASLLAPLRLGSKAANALLLLGEEMNATEAAQVGLADLIVAAPFDEAKAAAERLAQKPRRALRETKKLLKAANAPAIKDTIDREAAMFRRLLGSPEAQAAFQAFLGGKR
ncbi:MAG: enoyl-CoA hydratase-related protein [Neomegalonema sp.]|nr:enoyl-CoA hydratase-related protein [Neomegalonema sp.]